MSGPKHTTGPLEVRMDSTCSGAWAEIVQRCIDPSTGEEWFRELARTDTTHVERTNRKGQPLAGMPDTILEKPERFKILPEGEELIANAHLWAAASDLLAACQAEDEWRAREAAGALDPAWDYDLMVASKRREAMAKAAGAQR